MGVQVPISFVTQTVGLKEAGDLLRSSKTATDQLRDSSKKLGIETAAAGKQVSVALTDMRDKLRDLKDRIEHTKTSNSGMLKQLSAEYKTLQAEIDKTSKKLYEQQTAAKQSGQNWMSMVNSVRLFLTAGIVREVGQITLSMATMAGNIEGVSKAFNKLPNATFLLQELKRATHGTVDELSLMQQAMKFQNFRLPLQDLAKYMEFAAIRAQQTGDSVEYMMNSIVLGLGRGSIKILDNLQINIGALKKEMADAGITIQEAFGRQVQREMDKLGGYIVTAKTEVDRLNTNAKELYQTISQELSTGWLIKGTAGFMAMMKDFFKGGATIPGMLAQKAVTESFAAANDEVSDWLKVKQKELTSIQSTTSAIMAEINRRKENSIGIRNEADTLEDKIKRNEKEIERLRILRNEESDVYKREAIARKADPLIAENKSLEKSVKSMRERREEINLTIPIFEQFLKSKIKESELDDLALNSLEELRAKREKLANEAEQNIAVTDTKKLVAKGKELKALDVEIERIEILLGLKEADNKKDEEKIIGENKLTQARLNLIEAQKTFDAEFKRSGVTLEEIGFAWDNVTEKAEAYEQAVKNWDIGADLEESMKQLVQLADAWGKTMGVGSYKNIAKDAVIPTNDKIEQDTKETTDFAMGAWQDFFARFRDGWKEAGEQAEFSQENLNRAIADLQNSLWQTSQTILENTLNSEVAGYSDRIDRAKRYYDNIISLAGNNERKKVELQVQRDKEIAKLERKKDQAETDAAKRSAYINAATATMRAFAENDWYTALIITAGIAVMLAEQISNINKAPKGYAKGVIGLKGGGTETSDSIPAMLSKNESVMTAQETRDSFKTLHKIRAGKLNDKVLDKILAGGVTVVGSDDSHTAEKLDELIKITKANRPPDYVEKAGILYRVQTKGTNSKRYIRSKYGNFN